MTITPDNYLNFVAILINEVFGSVVLFLIIGVIIISYLCVINNIQSIPTLMINGFFILITMSIYFNQLWLAVFILVIAIIIYYRYGQIMNNPGG
jgi:hypothetical protein